MSTAPLSKLELPTDLREFSFDYSDGNSFRYSFMGSDFDSDTTNTQTNRFSFVSSVFDKEIEPQLDGGRARVHQVIPDIDDDLEGTTAVSREMHYLTCIQHRHSHRSNRRRGSQS